MKNKIVAAIPVKNEDWIIDKTLSVLDRFCDSILILDDNSTDKTEEICKSYDKVDWYVREKRDEFDGNRALGGIQKQELFDLIVPKSPDYILMLDADEIPTPSILPFLENIDESVTVWGSRMINLWQDENHYRYDSYTTKFGGRVNWDPFLPNAWVKYPLLKYDKEQKIGRAHV